MEVVTTSTKLFVYCDGKLVGSAGVKDPKDFDYDVLFAFATHEWGKKLEEV